MDENDKADFEARIQAAINVEPSFYKNKELQKISAELRGLYEKATAEVKSEIAEDVTELIGATQSGKILMTDALIQGPPADESESYYDDILTERRYLGSRGGGKRRRSKKRRSKKRRSKKRRTKKRRTSTRTTRRR